MSFFSGLVSSIGSLFGFDDGSDAQYAADVANTKNAYGIVGDSIAAYRDNRMMIGEQFESNMATARAKFAASGANLEGESWQARVGGLVKGRDEAYGEVESEENLFKAGTSYRLVREDYARMGVTSGLTAFGSSGSVLRSMVWQSSYSGEGFLSDEQKSNMLTSSQVGSKYAEYAASIKPSFDEYLEFRFGSDEEKAAYSDSMDSRIEASNLKYGNIGNMEMVSDSLASRFNSLR